MSSSSLYLVPSSSGPGYRFRSSEHLCDFADISAPYDKCKAFAPYARKSPHCSRHINHNNRDSVPQLVADLLAVTIPSTAACRLLIKLSSCVVCGVTSLHQSKAGEVYQGWLKKLWQEYLRACDVDSIACYQNMPVQLTREAWEAAVPTPRAPAAVATSATSVTPVPVDVRVAAAVDACPVTAIHPALVLRSSSQDPPLHPTLTLRSSSQDPPLHPAFSLHPAPRRQVTVFADPVDSQASVDAVSSPCLVAGRALRPLDVNADVNAPSTQCRTESQSTISCPPPAGGENPRDASAKSASQARPVSGETTSRDSSQKHNSPVVVICVGEDSSDEEFFLPPESSDIDDDDHDDHDPDVEDNESSGDEYESDDGDAVIVESSDGLEEAIIPGSEDENSEQDDAASIDSLTLSRSPSPLLLPTPPLTFLPYDPNEPHLPLSDLLNTMAQYVGPRGRREGYIYAFKRPSIPHLLKIGFTFAITRQQRQHFDPVEHRLKEWEKMCGHDAVEVFRVEVPATVRRIESLVHQTLRAERKVEQCGPCSVRKGLVGAGQVKTHKEWFEIGAAEAEAVVETWAAWAAEGPYDAFGRLTDFWAERVEDMREEAKEGHEPGEWLEGMGEWIQESRLWGFRQVTPVDESDDEGEGDR